MTADAPLDDALRTELTHIYQQIMWLARQSRVTPSMARAWYTHICAERVKRRLRCFTGSVSVAAATDPEQTLRLEHYLRIQTRLTSFVQSHLASSLDDPSAFIDVLVECERVHIVTVKENYDAMRASGDYATAGIELVPWHSLSDSTRALLWKKMLRGKVANARDFQPSANAVG